MRSVSSLTSVLSAALRRSASQRSCAWAMPSSFFVPACARRRNVSRARFFGLHHHAAGFRQAAIWPGLQRAKEEPPAPHPPRAATGPADMRREHSPEPRAFVPEQVARDLSGAGTGGWGVGRNIGAER